MTDGPDFPWISTAPERRASVRVGFRKDRRPDERIRLMGQWVDLVKPEEVLHHLQVWIADRRKVIVANHNLHSLYLLKTHPEMQGFYDRAEMVEVDSTPLLAFARLLGLNAKGFHRCTYLDWRDHFWSVANRNGWRVMYVGGEQAVIETAAARLSERYPQAVIAVQNGFFDATTGSPGNDAVLARVKDFAPQVLFVGMGMPRQELWVLRNLWTLPDCAIFSVGAAFDYEAGAQKAAPRWMGRLGVEWLFRLVADPKRLFTRYCIEPWSLIGLALADIRTAMDRRRLD